MDSSSQRKPAFPEAVRGLGRLLFSLPAEVRTVLLQHPQQRKGCLSCGIGAHSVYICEKTDAAKAAMLVDQAARTVIRKWSALIGEELMLFGAASSSQAYVDSAQPRCNDWKALRRPRYA